MALLKQALLETTGDRIPGDAHWEGGCNQEAHFAYPHF
jgi:hypothetical protein